LLTVNGTTPCFSMPLSKSPQASFIDHTVTCLRADVRIEAVLVAGSAITKQDDPFSDVDLVIVCRDADYDATMADRRSIAASLGSLLAAFTGEHVGEPRLLICLYNDPLRHVDLKFVRRESLAERVETPLIAFDRHGTIEAALRAGTATWPSRTPEWFEERFWIWIHYGATKIARGELFEAHDMLAFVRGQVLGPMLARKAGQRQRGVRWLEFEAPADVPELTQTIARYERGDCWRALLATVELYRKYRRDHHPLNLRPETERAVLDYIAGARLEGDGGTVIHT
jgi:predicted nucleotidyltransferase